MELHNKITIRKAIETHNFEARQLLLNGNIKPYIERFATITGLTPIFIENNLKQIRNWL